MSYKYIFKTTGFTSRYFTLSTRNIKIKNNFINNILDNNLMFGKLSLALNPGNRFLHITKFRYLDNSKQTNLKTNEMSKLQPEKPSISINKSEEKMSQSNPVPSKEIVKKSLFRKIIDEIAHYYHGMKLLYLDIKVAFGILNTLTKGNSLTRRERKQLVRTSADMVRMLPFLVFIIVPFMELLLPVYLKFFPFMLPSTFKVESKDKEYMLQKLKGKLEIAKFLQEAIAESAAVKKSIKQEGVDLATFSDFLKEVRESGLTADTQDILRFSHLFEDEVTLESLDPKYLKALCKLLDINAIGPSALLRFQLQMKVRQLKVDDQMIANEGMDKIPIWELQQLCRERGMRSYGVSEARLRYQLAQWLSLHLDKKVPTTLLLLSRVMYLPETLTPEEQLKQAILVLPKTVSNNAKLKVVNTEERIDHKAKFEVIKEEQQDIQKERSEAVKISKKPDDVAKVLVAETTKDSEDKAPVIEIKPADPDKAPILKISEIVEDKFITTPSVSVVKEVPVTPPEPQLTAEDLAHIESAVGHLEDKSTLFQKEELNVLKETREEIAKQIISTSDVEAKPPPQEKGVKRLENKLDKIINEIEKVVEKIDEPKPIKEIAEDIKLEPEVKPSVPETPDKVVPPSKRYIDIGDLLISLKKLQKSPDDAKWQTILSMLDEDHDGKIEMDHLIKVNKMLGDGAIKFTSTDISKLLETIDKEAAIVAETKKPKE